MKAYTSMRQYIKSKPRRCGRKVFTRAGASGIVYEFEIYVGEGTKESDLGMRFVVHLPKDIY
jgi:hypothetical protein